MIIHICGPSGSGKSILGKKIKKLKNVVIIETDEIDDFNRQKAIKKYNLLVYNKFIDDLILLNEIKIDEILLKYKNKNIIFIGFIHLGMQKLNTIDKKGFVIKISPEKLWHYYNLRTLNSIIKNHDELKKLLLNDNISSKNTHEIISFKFGIRNGFNCFNKEDMCDRINETYELVENEKFKYDTIDNIYKEIIKLLVFKK